MIHVSISGRLLAPIAVMICLVAGCGPPSFNTASLFSVASKSKPLPPGIKTAEVRIEELHRLADKAKTASTAEKEQLAILLAEQIQTESDPMLRKEFIRTIGTLGTPTSLAVLRAGLKDNDRDVRVACCEAWGKIGGPEAAAQLTGTLRSSNDVDVRLAATKALGQVRDPGSIAGLGEVLADSNPALQHRAMESLRSVTGQSFGDDVGAWRQYLAGGKVELHEPSMVERLGRLWR